MIPVLLDTNIILDFLLERKIYRRFAANIFLLAEKRKIDLYVTSLSFQNVYFIVKPVFGHKKALDELKILTGKVKILPVDKEVVLHSIQSEFTDFEDAMQYFTCLRRVKIEFIITRNTKDFKKTDIPAVNPKTFVVRFKNQ